LAIVKPSPSIPVSACPHAALVAGIANESLTLGGNNGLIPRLTFDIGSIVRASIHKKENDPAMSIVEAELKDASSRLEGYAIGPLKGAVRPKGRLPVGVAADLPVGTGAVH